MPGGVVTATPTCAVAPSLMVPLNVVVIVADRMTVFVPAALLVTVAPCRPPMVVPTLFKSSVPAPLMVELAEVAPEPRSLSVLPLLIVVAPEYVLPAGDMGTSVPAMATPVADVPSTILLPMLAPPAPVKDRTAAVAPLLVTVPAVANPATLVLNPFRSKVPLPEKPMVELAEVPLVEPAFSVIPELMMVAPV